MENHDNNRKNTRRGAEERRSALRRARIPLLTAVGSLAVAFVGLPLSFELLDIQPTVVEIAGEMVHAPVATPLPVETPAVVANALPGESLVTPQSSAAASRYSLLKLGDTDAGVVELQTRLAELMYIDGGEPTEYFGEPLETAVKRFQRVHHMNETGEADELTQELMFSEEAAVYRLQPGDSGEDVESMQDRLYELGYEVEKRNGYFGVATEKALISFQDRNRLEETGIMDSETYDVLYSNNARPKVDPTPTPTPKPKKTPAPTKRPSSNDNNDSSGEVGVTKTAEPSGGGSNTGGGGSVPEATGDVQGFINTALAQEGKPYILGDEGPNSFDCSGLVHYSLTQNGVKVGRMSASSFAVIDSWQTVSEGELRTGDLLFFWNDSRSRINHTGIWLGGNKYVHASSSRGQVVVSTWNNWAETHFSHGKRVF